MDAGRFDALSRSLARRRSRRSLGAGGLAAGLFAALGVEHAAAAPKACSLPILATTAVGPHAKKTYSGALKLHIGDGGAIDDGRFDLDDGTSLALVGQATGRALNLRITLADQTILALEGTAANDLILCRGAASGTFGGPDATDLGTWRTVAGTATTTGGASSGGNAGGTANGGSSGGGSTGNASGGGSACASGVVCAGVCCQAAPGLSADTIACSAGACECAYSCAAAGCPNANASGTIVATCGSDPQPQCRSACPVPADTGCGGMTCPSGQTLDAGACACVASGGGGCQTGLTKCGDNANFTCVDLVNDPANCGSCAAACPAGDVCQGGACAAGCASTQAAALTNCGGQCVDLNFDPASCGACGAVCEPPARCVVGVCCTATCAGTCVNLTADPNNCGACGTVCTSNQQCAAGACVALGGANDPCAAGGLVTCPGVAGCVDLNFDAANCGDCGAACPAGQNCTNGFCF